MKTTHRNYSDAAGDFNRLANFLIANNDYARQYSTWSMSRFVDWRHGLWGNKLSTPGYWDSNAHLWFDGFGELAGFALSESGGPDFVIIPAPGYGFLFDEMLRWVLANWGGRGPNLEVEVTDQQTDAIQVLEGAGFRQCGRFSTRRFDLSSEPVRPAALEDGFCIVDMQSHADARQQRLLRLDAFQNLPAYASEEEMQHELAADAYYRANSPIYHAATDLCVLAPDGRYASGCEALIDARNSTADIERICTHSQFRQRGFARAVIRECMFRLYHLGIRTVYITGYSVAAIALYGSLGHVAEKTSLIFKQEVGLKKE